MKNQLLFDDLYIACENLNFDWNRADVDEYIRLWGEDFEFEQIQRFFKRSHIECLLLYIDLVDRKKIKPRKRGIYH